MGIDRHDSKLIDIYGDKTAKAAAHPRVAYQREIHPRQVVFTCAQCGQEKTQWRYPGATPRYCSDECQDGSRRTKTRERVRRHREKKQTGKVQKASEEATSNGPAEKTLQVSLWLRVENNSKFTRGKTKARQRIEETILSRYNMQKEREDGWDYMLTIHYQTDEELERIIYDEILREADSLADLRYCFIEADMRALDGSGRSW